MRGLTRMRSLGQKCLEDPLSIYYMSSGSCKAGALLRDWCRGGGVVTEEVLIHWLRLANKVAISLTALTPPPKINAENNVIAISGAGTPPKSWFSTISNNPTLKAVDLISCAKLPRMLASLSRHSNCLGSWPPGWRCQRVCPLPRCCKPESITPINLAGEWNGDGDCFASVKINTPFSIRPQCRLRVEAATFLAILAG